MINKITTGLNLSVIQTLNIQGILDSCTEYGVTDKRQIAYILATIKHECDNKWQPIKEYGGTSYFIKRYWLNSRVAKWLGNDDANDAAKYFGRGYVQITGENNYGRFRDLIKLDLLNFPDLALQPAIASKIAVFGMKWGIFTGKKLDDYFNATQTAPINARKIINSLDKAELIAGYYVSIYNMIKD